ncbi:fatty acid desaturase-domain-containing protein [Lasiosphaeria miniovina]|uniref:Delta 8-(E)-sphingolipid desaturase n=1 Tax=Lasiosphaeria miniovina TaxID=1954250 RepID=A0AA40ADH6_9PEZI|nr:fatty acid desaturase-domain-containing protein [Lasiosphaeria miniovina]KAK0713821.1 fatty acid desaturase-domain-containing protein [Lasiosphaeria miniovina]
MATRDLKSQKAGGRSYPVLSRREVEAMIAQGRSIIIVDQHVLKVDAWLHYHPGGKKTIMHMVGRDASDEVKSLHSPEARRHMDRYRIGTVEGRWDNFLPPIQGGVFRLATSCDDSEVEDVTLTKSPSPNTTSSSRSGSRSPSPLFDVSDSGPSRRRRGQQQQQQQQHPTAQRSASASFVSSADAPAEITDGMAHLDALTRKEIKLDMDKYPSLEPEVQDSIVQKYRLLYERIKDEGLFDCNYSAYAIECLRYVSLFALMLSFLHRGWYITSSFFLGCFWHQLVFTAHDAGHMGITHSFQGDTLIGIIIADFLGGLSLGWWKMNHNVHHIVTNSPEHDPDIEHMPLFAVSHRFLGSLRSTYYERVMPFDAAAKFLVSLQHYSYYFFLLFGRFNLYRLSWAYIILGQGPRKGPAWWHRYLELAGNIFFWAWFGYGILYRCVDTNWHRFLFVMVSHMVTAPLHVQITLSHFAMSTADLGVHESFPQKMLRTTMDVDCPQWLDFFHGGLQFQAIHHLYPRLPRHNLRSAQRLVQEFCNEVGIPYALYGFVDGNKEVIGRLADVARQAAILAKCQSAITGSIDVDASHAHHF